MLGQIIAKSNKPPLITETILYIALKFQSDHTRFQRGDASTNFGVSNNTVSHTHTIKTMLDGPQHSSDYDNNIWQTQKTDKFSTYSQHSDNLLFTFLFFFFIQIRIFTPRLQIIPEKTKEEKIS